MHGGDKMLTFLSEVGKQGVLGNLQRPVKAAHRAKKQLAFKFQHPDVATLLWKYGYLSATACTVGVQLLPRPVVAHRFFRVSDSKKQQPKQQPDQHRDHDIEHHRADSYCSNQAQVLLLAGLQRFAA